MALSDLLEKIEQDTVVRIADLEKQFQEKMQSLEGANTARQKQIDEEMHVKVDERSKKIIEKAENLAERESSNKLLAAKRSVIDEALDAAVEALATAENYEEILTDMLKAADLPEDTVVVPAKGKEDLTKKAIKASGKKFFLSDKSAHISGGFILKTEKVEVDNSFETIIKSQLREELEIKLHKLLFQ